MKKLLLIGAAVMMCTAAQAEFQLSPYVSLKAAVVAPTSSTKIDAGDTVRLDDNVAGIRAALGVGTKAPLGAVRTEVELQWNDKPEKATHDADARLKGSLKSKALFVNGYYDFKTKSPFVPYVGAGVGASYLTGRASYTAGGFSDRAKVSDVGFAWNVGAGVAVRMTCALSFELGWRWTDYGHVNERIDGGKLKAAMKTNEVSLGMRYYF